MPKYHQKVQSKQPDCVLARCATPTPLLCVFSPITTSANPNPANNIHGWQKCAVSLLQPPAKLECAPTLSTSNCLVQNTIRWKQHQCVICYLATLILAMLRLVSSSVWSEVKLQLTSYNFTIKNNHGGWCKCCCKWIIDRIWWYSQ